MGDAIVCRPRMLDLRNDERTFPSSKYFGAAPHYSYHLPGSINVAAKEGDDTAVDDKAPTPKKRRGGKAAQ